MKLKYVMLALEIQKVFRAEKFKTYYDEIIALAKILEKELEKKRT